MTARVAVTGLGCVSGLGQGVEATWANLVSGQAGVRPLSRRYAGDDRFPIDGPAAFIEDFDGAAVETYAGKRTLPHLDPTAAYALVATLEALEDAGLLDEKALLGDAALIYGSASGGNATLEDAYARLFLKLQSNVHPLTIPKYMTSAAVGQISMLFGIRGMAFGIASACSSSAHAIGEGMHMVRAGRTKIAIVGGSDASITYGSWIGWKALQAMAPDACRPFSIDRKGMVLGEGAATIVLEDMDHALARGAVIHAELIGAGATSDAFHLTQPDGVGAVAAMSQAYRDAGIGPDTPALISTHGTGTPVNDKMEAEALREVCGVHLDRHAVIATKSAHGHLLGASGAIEFLVGICALNKGVAPPIRGYLGPDPDCDLPLVLDQPRPIEAEVLLSNSFAFGGMNSVLLARRLG
jgi:nodulation protein E